MTQRTQTREVGALLTIQTTARRCGVSPRTVWNWIAAGLLPVVRLGTRSTRIRETDLVAFLDARVEVRIA